MAQEIGVLSERVVSLLGLSLQPGQPIYLGQSIIAHMLNRHLHKFTIDLEIFHILNGAVRGVLTHIVRSRQDRWYVLAVPGIILRVAVQHMGYIALA